MTGNTSDFVQSDENWWKTTWQNGIAVGDVEYDESARIWSVDIAVRIDDPASGRSLGVMKAVLDVTPLQKIADDEAKSITEGQVSVVNSDGRLLAETGSQHSLKRIMAEGVNLRNKEGPEVQAAFTGTPVGFLLAKNDVMGYARSAGPEFYNTAVRHFAGFNWTVLVEQPKNVALAPVAGLAEVERQLKASRQEVLIGFGIVLLLAIAVGVIIAGSGARKIVGPLLSLRDLADAVSKGDTSRTVEIESGDEIQDLATSFNRMNNAVAIIMQRYKELKAKSKVA